MNAKTREEIARMITMELNSRTLISSLAFFECPNCKRSTIARKFITESDDKRSGSNVRPSWYSSSGRECLICGKKYIPEVPERTVIYKEVVRNEVQ